MSSRDQLNGYIAGVSFLAHDHGFGAKIVSDVKLLVDATVREAVLAAQEPHVWTDEGVCGSMVCTVCFCRQGEGMHT